MAGASELVCRWEVARGCHRERDDLVQRPGGRGRVVRFGGPRGDGRDASAPLLGPPQGDRPLRRDRGQEPRKRPHGGVHGGLDGPLLRRGDAAGRRVRGPRGRGRPAAPDRHQCRRGHRGGRRLLRGSGHRGRPPVCPGRRGPDPVRPHRPGPRRAARHARVPQDRAARAQGPGRAGRHARGGLGAAAGRGGAGGSVRDPAPGSSRTPAHHGDHRPADRARGPAGRVQACGSQRGPPGRPHQRGGGPGQDDPRRGCGPTRARRRGDRAAGALRRGARRPLRSVRRGAAAVRHRGARAGAPEPRGHARLRAGPPGEGPRLAGGGASGAHAGETRRRSGTCSTRPSSTCCRGLRRSSLWSSCSTTSSGRTPRACSCSVTW